MRSQKKNSQGNKAAFDMKGAEDRIRPYKIWRRTFSSDCLTQDLDEIEHSDTFVDYRVSNGDIVIKAIIELSTSKEPIRSHEAYLPVALSGITERTQSKVSVAVAKGSKVDAWFVIVDENLSGFSIFNLTRNKGWWRFNKEIYKAWTEKGCPYFTKEPDIKADNG